MPTQHKSVPTYCLHKQSGRGRAVWSDHAGVRHFKLLPGAFGSADSRAAYAKPFLEIEASPAANAPEPERAACLRSCSPT